MRASSMMRGIVLALPIMGAMAAPVPEPGLFDGLNSLLSAILHPGSKTTTTSSKAVSTAKPTSTTPTSTPAATSKPTSIATSTTSSYASPSKASSTLASSTAPPSSTVTQYSSMEIITTESELTYTPSIVTEVIPTTSIPAPLAKISEYPSNKLPVTYFLTLKHGNIAPDGVKRMSCLINGQSPGPTLEVYEGQRINVVVTNLMSEGATLHWHGLIQDEVWNDGVPGVTQYPIGAFSAFTYTFVPHQHGQYWYHSHYHSQLEDGCRGAFTVFPSPNRPQPFSLISTNSKEIAQMKAAELNPAIIQLADWSHYTSNQLETMFEESGVQPLCSDSFLIGGRGAVICKPQAYLNAAASFILQPVTDKGCAPWNSPILEVGNLPPGSGSQDLTKVNQAIWSGCSNTSSPLTVYEVDQRYGYASISVIHTGGDIEQRISIDGHKFIVYAADGHYVEPYTADLLVMAVGMRYQAMVKLDNPGDWTIRTTNNAGNQIIGAYAVLSYVTKSQNKLNDCGSASNGLPALCGNKRWYWTGLPSDKGVQDYAGNDIGSPVTMLGYDLVPFDEDYPVPQTATKQINFDIQRDNYRLWQLDDRPYLKWRAQNIPILVQPQKAIDDRVAIDTNIGDVVDMYFQIGPGSPAHPFHKHDVKAWIIGYGNGVMPGGGSVADAIKASPSSFNLKNPPLRDTFRAPPAATGPSWIVIRYEVIHTGVVVLHCHIGTHLASGMAAVTVEQKDKLPKIPKWEPHYFGKILTANPSPTLADGYYVGDGI